MKVLPKYKEQENIVTIDSDSAPRLLFYGEDLLLEDLPIGTRVIYPNQPLQPLSNPRAAIRYALTHPEEAEPLHAQLTPGMKVTIAIDDISLPLPPMRTPDARQLVLEAVLEMLADYGVEDVEIVIAVALHRHMTAAEVRRMVGNKIFDAFWPERLYNHDAEAPGGIVELGRTEHGEPVRIGRRPAESDLLIYVNINLVPMDGGHKSVGVGLTDYEGLKAHHNPTAIKQSWSYMDPSSSELHHSCDRLGRIVNENLNVFHIETVLNNRMFAGPMEFLSKNEDQFTELDRLKLGAMKYALSKAPHAARRELFMRVPAAYELIAVHAGQTDAVHRKTLEACFRQYAVKVRGQCDILVSGIPYISPYNVNSKALNPLLVQVMANGYFFNMYRGKPLLREGGVLIVTHPVSDAFDPVHHPSYIEFFHRCLAETRNAEVLLEKYEEEFARNPSYIEMYRRGNAYHGAHPFYMWYWGENGRKHIGKTIVVGPDNAHVPERLGWESADTLEEAIAMGRQHMGRSAEITMLHHPPILIVDVE